MPNKRGVPNMMMKYARKIYDSVSQDLDPWIFFLKNYCGSTVKTLTLEMSLKTFFMDFYICWQYAISFSAKFPMLKFSPGPSTLAPPLSGGFFLKSD